MATDSPPPRKRIKLDYTEDVKISVKGGKKFTIHKSVLVQTSTLFRALSKNDKAGLNVIRLPDVQLNLFSIYVQWLYSGSIVLLESEKAEKDVGWNEQGNLIVDLCALAGRLKDMVFQNALVNFYLAGLEAIYKGPSTRIIRHAWQSLPRSSPFIKAITDWYLAVVGVDFVRDNEHIPAPFVMHLACEALAHLRAGSTPIKPSSQPQCTYHIHNEDAPKCAYKPGFDGIEKWREGVASRVASESGNQSSIDS